MAYTRRLSERTKIKKELKSEVVRLVAIDRNVQGDGGSQNLVLILRGTIVNRTKFG